MMARTATTKLPVWESVVIVLPSTGPLSKFVLQIDEALVYL